MTPQMDAALGANRVMLLGLLKIQLPDRTIRLCDGSISVVWNGDTFTGRDAVFGTIAEVEEIVEEVGDTMPGLDVSFYPPALSSAISLCHPDMQGAPMYGWLAVIDAETGLVIPEPEMLFAGEVDVPILEVEDTKRRVTMQIVSVFERLMMPDEGARMADNFHQWVWPGELGLSQMTGTPVERLWGPGDKPPAATYVPGTPYGGPGYDYYNEPSW